MASELSRQSVAVFCPAEQRLIEFIYVRMEPAPDLAWCQECFLVCEVRDGELRCPKTGEPTRWGM